MQALHDKKSDDYGVTGDPFANVRASAEFGVPPWLGAIIRLNDKITRIKSFSKNGSLSNESLRDSLIDIAVYAPIALTLFDEEEMDAAAEELLELIEEAELEDPETWDWEHAERHEARDAANVLRGVEEERLSRYVDAPPTCTEYMQAHVNGPTHLCWLERGHEGDHESASGFRWKQQYESQAVSD